MSKVIQLMKGRAVLLTTRCTISTLFPINCPPDNYYFTFLNSTRPTHSWGRTM